MPAFTAWPKTPRFFRNIIVTEKIDGTNAAIHIERLGDVAANGHHLRDLGPEMRPTPGAVLVGSDIYRLTAQSRNRLIYPGKSTDNSGFAAWVQANAARLVEHLGIGLHFGEWWGQGINRGYGLTERRFSLFNTDRYGHLGEPLDGGVLSHVPVLYQGTFRESMIRCALEDLAENGSKAAPGFADPEGVIVWHSQTRTCFKVTLDNNDAGKWESVTP